jgi:acetyl esterase
MTAVDQTDHRVNDVDPDIRRFVTETSAAYAAGGQFDGLSFPARRRLAEAVRAPWRQGGPAMARSLDLVIETPHGPVKARLHDPSPTSPKPVLIYLHGGGWTLFSIETHDRVMREYAVRSGMAVLGVDYALSPEAKFPVALEQVEAVAVWLRASAAGFGLDPARIAIGGDSAGACLSMATAIKLRDRGLGDLLKAMLLAYPVFDTEISDDADRRYGGEGYMLSGAEMAGFWNNYLSSLADTQNPLARPALADLAGLPPACLTIAECDVLAEQAVAMGARLRVAGVSVRTDIYRGATHSFLEAVSIAPVARKAIDDGAAWLRGVLN